MSALKYLALGLLFANGGAVYDSVIRSVLGAFNQMAHTMAGVGPNDVFTTWKNELVAAASSGTFLNVITGGVAGILSALLLLVAMILYPVAYAIFTILYALYGTILYTTGPLVLALMPSMGIGTLARRYAVNFMIFGAWGLIYGIFCRLAMALNINSMAAITGAGTFGGHALRSHFRSSSLRRRASCSPSASCSSPFSRNESWKETSEARCLLCWVPPRFLLSPPSRSRRDPARDSGRRPREQRRARAAVVPPPRHRPGAPPAGPAPSGAAATATPTGPVVAAGGGSAPAGPAPSGGGRMGHYRPVNIPHAVGWLAGAAAAVGVRGGQRAVVAGRNLVTRAASAAGRGDSEPT